VCTNEHPQPLRRALVVCCILLLVATALSALSACSGNLGPRTHEGLTPLDIPNIQRLTEYSKLAPSTSSELIDSLITYVELDHHSAQAVTAIDGKMYVSNLDGTNGRRLDTSYPCFAGAVSPDGKWLACPNETSLSGTHDDLQVTSLKPGEWFPTHIVHLGFEGDAAYPAWSPDGHLLAIVRDEFFNGRGCAISIFSGSPPYRAFTHVAELSAQEFDNGVCPIRSLRWSPDGEWLAVGASGIRLISIRDLLRDTPDESGSPAYVLLPEDVLIPLTDPQDAGSFAPAWNPQNHLLTFLTGPRSDDQGKAWAPQRIMAYDPASQQRAVLLTVPLTADPPTSSLGLIQHMSTLAWSPDGQHLLFVVDEAVNCVDCPLTHPSQMYMFTPAPTSV
jgi:WD40 repeat protein